MLIPESEGISLRDQARIKAFVITQVVFAFGSLLAGGIKGRPWSYLDTALLVLSLGITGLAFVLETRRACGMAMKVAVTLYLLGVVDMSFNILASGVLGLKPFMAAAAGVS